MRARTRSGFAPIWTRSGLRDDLSKGAEDEWSSHATTAVAEADVHLGRRTSFGAGDGHDDIAQSSRHEPTRRSQNSRNPSPNGASSCRQKLTRSSSRSERKRRSRARSTGKSGRAPMCARPAISRFSARKPSSTAARAGRASTSRSRGVWPQSAITGSSSQEPNTTAYAAVGTRVTCSTTGRHPLDSAGATTAWR